MGMAQCIMTNCRRAAPVDEAFCSKHRPVSLHQELQDKGGSLNLRALAYITDHETWSAGLVALIRRCREYVQDSLEAHEHSDGRDLLNDIDSCVSNHIKQAREVK